MCHRPKVHELSPTTVGLRPWFSHELIDPHHRGLATPICATHRATPNWTTHRATPNWTTPNWTTAKWTTAKWTIALLLCGVDVSNLERLLLQRAFCLLVRFVCHH